MKDQLFLLNRAYRRNKKLTPKTVKTEDQKNDIQRMESKHEVLTQCDFFKFYNAIQCFFEIIFFECNTEPTVSRNSSPRTTIDT